MSALPVVDEGRVVGVVTEASILALLAGAMRTEASDSDAAGVPIGPAVRPQSAFAHRNMTVGEVADVFATTEEDVLPVVDDHGGFHGVVSRSDLLAYLSGSLRPANVAGMATPLGVYLTNGSIRAGAGDIGLVLGGMTLGLNMVIAWLIVWLLAAAVQATTGVRSLAILDPIVYGPPPRWVFAAQWLPPALAVVFIMVLIRLSPLSGYHAAEHMTVHAIEVGEELSPDVVRNMPRVHGRCGTNLLAAAMVFLIIVGSFSGEIAILAAMVVVIVGWRSVGGFIQQLATTKTPTEKQLANGVRVGRELVEKFHERPNYQVYGFHRMWNSGLLQSMAGLSTVLGVAAIISDMLLHRYGISLPF